MNISKVIDAHAGTLIIYQTKDKHNDMNVRQEQALPLVAPEEHVGFVPHGTVCGHQTHPQHLKN